MIHRIAIAAGANFSPEYEFNGQKQPATYTLTLQQLQTVTRQQLGPSVEVVAIRAGAMLSTTLDRPIPVGSQLYGPI